MQLAHSRVHSPEHSLHSLVAATSGPDGCLVGVGVQVGVFDLYHNRVLQQVCVTEALGSPDASSVLVGCQRQVRGAAGHNKPSSLIW